VFREEVTRLALEKPDAFELKVQNGRIKVEDKRPDGVTEHDWAMMNDFGDPEWDRSQTRLKNADN
jgi:hypothetical protein